MNPLTQFKKTTILPFLTVLTLVSFGISPRVAAQGVLGRYELTFCPGSILYVNDEVIFHAYVADSLGVPATAGAVVFQICSRGGVRGGSGAGTDPQPSSACDIDGTAQWVRIYPPLKVSAWAGSCLPCLPNGTGNVCTGFGGVAHARTIGFRFKYIAQGSGIASRTSLPKDVTWLPLP
jgi:hypothetical protein